MMHVENLYFFLARFGTSKRDGLSTRSGSVPGPGTYTQPSTLVNKPISLTARRDSFKVDTKIPGPGAYDINDRFVSLRKQELVTKYHTIFRHRFDRLKKF